jgi:hypothetical protein
MECIWKFGFLEVSETFAKRGEFSVKMDFRGLSYETILSQLIVVLVAMTLYILLLEVCVHSWFCDLINCVY